VQVAVPGAQGNLDRDSMTALAAYLTMMTRAHDGFLAVYYPPVTDANRPDVAEAVHFTAGGVTVDFFAGHDEDLPASMSFEGRDRRRDEPTPRGGILREIIESDGTYTISADGTEVTITTGTALTEFTFTMPSSPIRLDGQFRQITPLTAPQIGGWLFDLADGYYLIASLEGDRFYLRPGLHIQHSSQLMILMGRYLHRQPNRFLLEVPIEPDVRWRITSEGELTIAGLSSGSTFTVVRAPEPRPS
jgi:hypothetical protein